jgi:uncharacterized protein
MADYVPRLLDRELAEVVSAHPAVMIVGPRASGKTTTAARYAASTVRLDRPREAAAFIADADAALALMAEPVLLDEWQAAPDVLGAVKRAVDTDSRPGRFILTGSVRADLDTPTWPGTGRVIRLRMWGLNERERMGATHLRSPLDVLAEGDPMALALRGDTPDLPGYIDIALRGGFPEPGLALDGRDRERWLTSYVEQVLTRDAAESADRDPVRLARYFEALALNSAGVVADATVYRAAGVDRKTALGYDRLLSNLYVIDEAPAWFTNRLARLVKSSKRYIVDAALVAAALRLDTAAVLRDGDLIGRVLDTFVAAQFRPELEVSRSRPRIHHLRDKNGRHEVDLLIELQANRVVAIEVKASAAPKSSDAAHIAWLRDQLGDRFVCGVVLHTGPGSFSLGDRITALPIAALWGGSPIG